MKFERVGQTIDNALTKVSLKERFNTFMFVTQKTFEELQANHKRKKQLSKLRKKLKEEYEEAMKAEWDPHTGRFMD